jgi:hypothetical protein
MTAQKAPAIKHMITIEISFIVLLPILGAAYQLPK